MSITTSIGNYSTPSGIWGFTAYTGLMDYEYLVDNDLGTVGQFDLASGTEGEFNFNGIGVPSGSGTIIGGRIRVIFNTQPSTNHQYTLTLGTSPSTSVTSVTTGSSNYPELVLTLTAAQVSQLTNTLYLTISADNNAEELFNISSIWAEVDYEIANTTYTPIVDVAVNTTTPSKVYLPSHFSSSTGLQSNIDTTPGSVGLYLLDNPTRLAYIEYIRGSQVTPLWYRPTSITTTGLTVTNPGYAYDTSTTTLDQSTYSEVTSIRRSEISTQQYQFTGSSNVTGTLHVFLPYVFVQEDSGVDKTGEPFTISSRASVAVSITGGNTWETFNETCSWNGATSTGGTNIHLTKALSNISLQNILVKMTEMSAYNGVIYLYAGYQLRVSDILILPS